MDEILRLVENLPSIPVDADNIKVIETPEQFYNTLIAKTSVNNFFLKNLTKSARKRIALSTLYLGNGKLEENLIDELDKALDRCPGMELNILLDYLRGTRDGEKSSAAILRRLLPRARIHLFHTPYLRGILKSIIPQRTNEVVGLQHMKLYIFDDSIVISGANLSESYFTNRQDRYILIENVPELAQFWVGIIDAVCSCSFKLQPDGGIDTSERCAIHPFKGALKEYENQLRARLFEVLKCEGKKNVNKIESDTRIYPLIQMGMFRVNQEYDFLKELFASQDTSSKIILTSGYFNLIGDYEHLITKRGKYSMDVIYASPQANGFYKGSGLSGYIPSLYVLVSETFFGIKRQQVELFEYERDGWTYHAKGLWVQSTKSPFCATLVGSSNYGQEHVRLLEWSGWVEASTFLRPDHMVPRWDKMSHRRYNPLRDEWVIVAANRLQRPWQGATESGSGSGFMPSTTVNPLAPGGHRANGQITPHYTSTFVFQNDFPALRDNADEEYSEGIANQLYRSHSIKGTCRVMCYHPNSDLSMAQMSHEQLEAVIDMWIEQMNELEKKYEWIQIFENRGALVGCSNAHPHGQLWASDYLPTYPAKEYSTQKTYHQQTGKIMLMEVVEEELRKRERLVVENDEWIVVVPFWATWPFETLLLPIKHSTSLNKISKEQKRCLADIMKKLVIKYDNLFKCAFPFSMGWKSAPTGRFLSENRDFWTLHAVYLPPLLRSASVKKFIAGYELVAEPQRDILPEKAAEMLREQNESVHFTEHIQSRSTPISS
ncbi:unnamed protein product [Anisakis simplex]|uniref:Galactose-1-phosphate uridylyltransferase n=1 Tax=Anisakis simplex TaxID=6269 RepID=A0A0M3JWN9_ANISI|nr:unnamed protein product [Anisakis simplex]